MKSLLLISLFLMSTGSFAARVKLISADLKTISTDSEMKRIEKDLVLKGYELSGVDNLTVETTVMPLCDCSDYKLRYVIAGEKRIKKEKIIKVKLERRYSTTEKDIVTILEE